MNREDIFNRTRVSDYIFEIVKHKEEIFDTEQSLIISIDSPWGTGKTTFLEMWEKELKENQDIKLLSYNAWIDDDLDNPLISITMKIHENIENTNIDAEKIKSSLITSAGIIAKSAAKNYLANKVVNYIGINGTDEVKKVFGEILGDESQLKETLDEIASTKEKSSYVEEHQNYINVKNEFRKTLMNLTKHKKVFFLIDELDRCRPSYAIKTLETIKHYFNIPGIVFIFALDMEQLKHSIATIYGQNMDSYGYLRRFFNHSIKLPKPSLKKYLSYIDKNNILSENQRMLNVISDIFETLELTLRDVDVVYINLKILNILKLKKCNDEKKMTFYAYLIALKYKYPQNYDLICHQLFILNIKKQVCDRNEKELPEPLSFSENQKEVSMFLDKLQMSWNTKTIAEFCRESDKSEFFVYYISVETIPYEDTMRVYEYIELVMEGIGMIE
ncbi:KAP family P-loop domain-containing protein [Anaerosporobacter mobilis DSM 15930]|jgi:hypothetical protein|uniref:KAP family P-loop domain-containing protein n=1 Tax=Anaerosporobacter mobilis DSM 15930 TaxID=1120996 RepID=A0A1M7N899_9FIRM|nr:P-loop NTPase fold protein [Anaerosporobacter mobilis]SHM99849.1 KAP family P-loop domain-containing protein [Anaerosporobacter mobilis DSM 15930]